MKRIVILISHRGSNMEAIVAASRRERWSADVVRVVASRSDAPGIESARQAGIETVVVDSKSHADRVSFEAALVDSIDVAAPDCVVLAGFMRVLSDAFVLRYMGRMLNIHPSLLPAFAGLHTHERALAAGVRIHGATVHFVSPVVDGGAIVAQAALAVRDDDTRDTLAARVLELEHALYPRAVRWFVDGDVALDGDRVRRSALASRGALTVAA